MGLSAAYDYLTSFYSRAKRNAKLQQRKANTSGDSFNSSGSQDVYHSVALAPRKVRHSAITTGETGETMYASLESSEECETAGSAMMSMTTSNTLPTTETPPGFSEEDGSFEEVLPSNLKKGGKSDIDDGPPVITDFMIHLDTTSTNLAVDIGVDGYTSEGMHRKISSYTALSEISSTTVNHDPTKRATSPIETVVRPVMPSEAESNPFSDGKAIGSRWEGGRCVLVPRGSSQTYSNETGNSDSNCYNQNQETAHTYNEEAGLGISRFEQLPEQRRDSHRLSHTASQRLIAGNREERRELLRSRAILRFNASAEYYGIDHLAPGETTEPSVVPVDETEKPVRQTSLLNRLRKVRSNLTVKRNDSSKHRLRRIKTMANMNNRVEYGTLQGRTIDELARLGGESMLTFPSEYVPGVLRLPTCIAAPIHFLQQHGTSAPYGYGGCCDESVVLALYGHYATQILRAERVKETINRTTRSVRLPSGYMYQCARTKGDAHVQDVSTVLRHFLCELPGGILGPSSYLYRVLAQLHEQDFSAADDVQDPGRKDYIPETAAPIAAKVRMVALALLALTADMQLELICAVFGLLALTADECADRKTAHQYLHVQGAGAPCEFCMTLPTPRTLGRVFGYFLNDAKSVRELRPPAHFKLANGEQSAEVATMLINLWKGISTQLRWWGVLEP